MLRHVAEHVLQELLLLLFAKISDNLADPGAVLVQQFV